MLFWVTEGEVLLGEQVSEGEVPQGEAQQEVPQGEAEREVPQGEAEGEVPLGEQDQEISDHGLPFIFGG